MILEHLIIFLMVAVNRFNPIEKRIRLHIDRDEFYQVQHLERKSFLITSHSKTLSFSGQQGVFVRYRKGQLIEGYKDGPSIRYIGRNVSDFFLKRARYKVHLFIVRQLRYIGQKCLYIITAPVLYIHQIKSTNLSHKNCLVLS